MLKRYQHVVAELFRGADICVIVGAWLAAYWVRFYLSPFDTSKAMPSFYRYASLAPLIAIIWISLLTFGVPTSRVECVAGKRRS